MKVRTDKTPIFKWIWEACPAKNGDKLILLAIALFCDANGDGWVAPEMLQAKTGMTRRNIARCIDKCVAKGWLLITQEQQIINGRRFARHYRIPVKSDNLSEVGQFVQDSDNLSKKSDNLSPHNNTMITSLTGAPPLAALAPVVAPVASQPSLPSSDIAPNSAPKKRKPRKTAPHPILRPDLDDQAWFRHLSSLPEYSHVKIAEEYGRCRTWCRNKGVGAVSRRRFVNWLGKVEKPLSEPTVQIAQRTKSDDYYAELERRVGGIKA